jgi:hypothetical protein
LALARWRLCLAFACVAAGLAAGAAPASAQGGFDLNFHFSASNGYRMTVGGYGSTAFINVARPDGSSRSSEWSTYIARGKVSPSSIDADFGNLGSAEMRFKPSGQARLGRRHRGCIGRDRYTIRPGFFVGSVRFRGEGDYTSANVHRVRGKQVTPRLLFCRDTIEQLEGGASQPRGTKSKATKLGALMRSGLTATAFSAVKRSGGATFLAQIEQSVGSVAVSRGVFVHASPATFASDSQLSFAGVTPPPPFTGTATLQRAPDGHKEWSGPLAVSFPGAPGVPLTGPRYKAQLTRGW